MSSLEIDLKEQKSESSSERPTDLVIQDLLDQLDSLEKPMTMRSTDAEKLPTSPLVTKSSRPLPQNVILNPIPPPPSATSRLPVSPRRRIIGIKTFRSTQQANPAEERIEVYNFDYNHFGRILISPKGG